MYDLVEPCPSGDDPWTTGQLDTVQAVSCKANGGSFTLSFRGETTRAIPSTSTAAAIQYSLESLITSVGPENPIPQSCSSKDSRSIVCLPV